MKTIKKLSLRSCLVLVLATIPIASANSGTNDIKLEEGHLSTLQVIERVKKTNKGRIIKAERKSTKSHPNCHHIKMKTDAGEFKLIRFKCP